MSDTPQDHERARALIVEVVLALAESHNFLAGYAPPEQVARFEVTRSVQAIEQLQLAGGLDAVIDAALAEQRERVNPVDAIDTAYKAGKENGAKAARDLAWRFARYYWTPTLHSAAKLASDSIADGIRLGMTVPEPIWKLSQKDREDAGA